MIDWKQIFVFVILFVGKLDAVAWDANSYPNPTTQAGAKQCGLRSAGHLCDPDGILPEGERYRINHDLSRLESKTYQEFGRNFCEKKGLNGVIGLAKNVKGGSEADVRRMATELRQRWNLDQQCLKSIVIIISIEDRKFWVSRDSKVPVYAGEFSEILNGQTPLFRDKKYQQAIGNIIQQTIDKTLSKQGQLPSAPIDDGRGGGTGRKDKIGSGGGGGMPSGFKFPNIPVWLILVIVFLLLLLCCCSCCIYCCCCRNKDGGVRRQGPSDEDPEIQGQGRQGGGIGNTLRGMLSGAGGGMIMNAIQNCFRNRGQGQHQPTGPVDNRGGYVPPRPQAEEGKGLYPSKPVEDEGAGGGW